MAARSSWKGFLKLSLVSVPVKAYTATASGGGGEIHLNQLHAECNSRIQYRKNCPIHGEVTQDQIVSGYEYSKGQYVVIDPDELEKLRTEDDKAIKIDSFVPTDFIDPVYHTGKTYYLVPDGPIGLKPYAVIHRGMVEQQRHAISQVVMHGKEQLVLVRPIGKLLAMSILSYDNQVTKASNFEDDVPPTEVTPEELQLAKTLISASTALKPDYTKYKDVYTERLTKLIEAKVAGEELVAAPVQEHAQIINLMDALRQSVAAAGAPAEAAAAGSGEEKPPKKMAGAAKKPAAARKRKQA